MRYKIILEAEFENIKDAAAVLTDISARLPGGGMKAALLNVCSCPAAEGGVPTKADVEGYFSSLLLPPGVSAKEEAAKFYGYNTRLGWKYAAIWQKLARDWAARIRVEGKAASFDADEFFAAALEASAKKVIGKSE